MNNKHTLCTSYKIIFGFLAGLTILCYNNVSHANNFEVMGITHVTTNDKLTSISNINNTKLRLVFSIPKKEAPPQTITLDILAEDGSICHGAIDPKQTSLQLSHTKTGDYYVCAITASFLPGELANYRTFFANILDHDGTLIGTITGENPPLQVALLPGTNNQYDTLELKNIGVKTIEISKITSEPYFSITKNNFPIIIESDKTTLITITHDKNLAPPSITIPVRISHKIGETNLHSTINLSIINMDSAKNFKNLAAGSLLLNPDNNTSNQISILAAGVADSQKNTYEIKLLLKNNIPYLEGLSLNKDFKIKAIDINGKEYDLKITNKKTTYSNECKKGVLKDECVVTLLGTIKNPNVTLKSLRVTTSYNQGRKTATQVSEVPIKSELECQHNLQMESQNLGYYALTITNSSPVKQKILSVELQSKCIQLYQTSTKPKLDSLESMEFRFAINPEINLDNECEEFVSITYQEDQPGSPIKTVLIPIKITRNNSDHWYSWNNYGWMIAVGVAVVVIVATVIYLHHSNDIDLNTKQIFSDSSLYNQQEFTNPVKDLGQSFEPTEFSSTKKTFSDSNLGKSPIPPEFPSPVRNLINTKTTPSSFLSSRQHLEVDNPDESVKNINDIVSDFDETIRRMELEMANFAGKIGIDLEDLDSEIGETSD